VERVLVEAWASMQEEDKRNKFHVVVVDSRPLLEGTLNEAQTVLGADLCHAGKQLLSVLTSHGIPTTYTLLSSLPSILPRTSLVLLGTAALLSDGALYSRAGTAVLAMLAKESKIPVVACCETYKFGDKIVLDAVTGNELGKPC
jgi:translation initiation factor eIF-2B subunit delta